VAPSELPRIPAGPDPSFAGDAPYFDRDHLDSAAMSDNDLVKRLAWSGLVAGIGALASIVTTRVAAVVFRRIFGEDPPE
jgi:hypothetical protein